MFDSLFGTVKGFVQATNNGINATGTIINSKLNELAAEVLEDTDPEAQQNVNDYIFRSQVYDAKLKERMQALKALQRERAKAGKDALKAQFAAAKQNGGKLPEFDDLFNL